jgi:predicted site-specific integrase-resolvase
MNIDDSAKALGVSTKTLRGYIKKGVIEARLVEGKTGKEWNIEPSSLEAIKENKASRLVTIG